MSAVAHAVFASSTQTMRALSVMARVGPVAVAIAAPWITRLTLPDAVRTVRSGWPALVEVGGARYVAWDLGVLLFRKPVDGAWLLMRVPMAGTSKLAVVDPSRPAFVDVALRTGPCFSVGATPSTVPLPSKLFAKRPRAMVGAFAPPNGLDVPFGLSIDPAGLWTPDELATSASLLAREEGA